MPNSAEAFFSTVCGKAKSGVANVLLTFAPRAVVFFDGLAAYVSVGMPLMATRATKHKKEVFNPLLSIFVTLFIRFCF